jgi:hypothetical protein
MTDTTQGADAPDDNALFNDAVTTTLDKFENPEPAPLEKPADPKPADPQATPKPGDKPADPKPADPPDGPVPSGRFREESEARRRAERERDELRTRLDAMSRQPPPQQRQEPPKKLELFDNPQGFIKQELQPFLEQIRADFQSQREAQSLDWAMRSHGEEKVGAARRALEEGMARGDQQAWGAYNRAMQSHDPYSHIVKWHQDGETLRSIGGDLTAYRSRILDEAMKDPEFQKRVFDAAKGQATATGNNVARPVRAAASPSLGNVGAGGGDAEIVEPSDEQLFRAAVTAKRR